jgi:mitogen-activated protein kinase kinase kinase
MIKTTGIFVRVREVEERDGEKSAELGRHLQALMSKGLSHKNLIAYLGYERRDSSFITLSEYVISNGTCNGSVASYIREYGKWEESITRSSTYQIVQGLAYLHAKGVLHNNLGTNNILLDLDGTIKIAGFDIPAAANSFENASTPKAPEVVSKRGYSRSDKVDVWSLGAIVIEMFYGRIPWSQNDLDVIDEKPLESAHISKNILAEIGLQGQSFISDCFTM